MQVSVVTDEASGILPNATQLAWFIPDYLTTPQCLALWHKVTVHKIIKRDEGKFVHVVGMTHRHGRLYTLGKLGGRLGKENPEEKNRKHFDGCTSQNWQKKSIFRIKLYSTCATQEVSLCEEAMASLTFDRTAKTLRAGHADLHGLQISAPDGYELLDERIKRCTP